MYRIGTPPAVRLWLCINCQEIMPILLGTTKASCSTCAADNAIPPRTFVLPVSQPSPVVDGPVRPRGPPDSSRNELAVGRAFTPEHLPEAWQHWQAVRSELAASKELRDADSFVELTMLMFRSCCEPDETTRACAALEVAYDLVSSPRHRTILASLRHLVAFMSAQDLRDLLPSPSSLARCADLGARAYALVASAMQVLPDAPTEARILLPPVHETPVDLLALRSLVETTALEHDGNFDAACFALDMALGHWGPRLIAEIQRTRMREAHSLLSFRAVDHVLSHRRRQELDARTLAHSGIAWTYVAMVCAIIWAVAMTVRTAYGSSAGLLGAIAATALIVGVAVWLNRVIRRGALRLESEERLVAPVLEISMASGPAGPLRVWVGVRGVRVSRELPRQPEWPVDVGSLVGVAIGRRSGRARILA